MSTYGYADLVEAAERTFAATDDPARVWRRVQAELPGVDATDLMIAGRLRQARIHHANGECATAAACAVQLARDLTGLEGIAPAEAWAFLRRLDNPMLAEFLNLFDEARHP